METDRKYTTFFDKRRIMVGDLKGDCVSHDDKFVAHQEAAARKTAIVHEPIA